MPSPFPGMNPYLERPDEWQDFHNRFVIALGDALTALVRPNYIVKVEQYVFIHEPSAEYRLLIGHGDVTLARPLGGEEARGGTATLVSPFIARVPNVDFEKHVFLELRDRKNRELVTVLELLSPTNKKPGADREQYPAKRANLLHCEANFVEIDLLRAWPKMPIEDAKECDYSILVSRVEDRPQMNYWPLKVRESLPKIPIPLRSPDGFVNLDLKAVLDGVYDRAGYQDYIYLEEPHPPLSPEDAAWAASLIPPQS
jgi:Protein of unknown function (DUF4058)